MRGDGQPITKIVAADEQRRALAALLQTIDPAALTLPDRVLNLIPPRPPGYPRTRETFPHRTGLTFDPVAAAESAADLTVSLILDPQRAGRLVQYHSQDVKNPGLGEVIDQLVSNTWRSPMRPGLQGEVARTVNLIVLTPAHESRPRYERFGAGPCHRL